MEQNTWDINRFYTQAWQIIKTYKMLWIFGIAASAGGGASLRSGQNFKAEDFKGLENFFNKNNHDSVLGAATQAAHGPSILDLFATVPLYIYALLAISMVSLLVMSVVISVLYKAWSQACLLHATEKALQDEKLDLHTISLHAFSHLKSFLWLAIVPPLFLFSGGFVTVFLIFSLVALGTKLLPLLILGIVVLLAAIPVFTFATLFYSLITIWAPRNVIYYNLSGKDAFLKGYAQTKGRFWNMVILGIVNTVAGGLVTFIPIALVVGVVVALGLTVVKANPNTLIAFVPLGFIVGVALIIGISLLSGIITSFKAVVWSLAYKAIH